jgi:hypothetical protein
MFANLYTRVKSSRFRDHNFEAWPPGHRIRSIPESEIEELIKGYFDVPDQFADKHAYIGWVEVGFEFSTIFEQSLSRRACAAFFRAEPDVPAVDRDYYLSKLYQFLCLLAMECHDYFLTRHRDWVRNDWVSADISILERFLDSLPEDCALEQLAEFDWQEFRNELGVLCETRAVKGDLLRTLGDLHRFLPSPVSQLELTAPLESVGSRLEAVRRSIAGMTSRRLQEWWSSVDGSTLLKSARDAHGHVQKEAASKCGVALGTYKKWEAGRTPLRRFILRAVDYIEVAPGKIVVQLPGR